MKVYSNTGNVMNGYGTSDWVLQKAGVRRAQLGTGTKMLQYFGHTTRHQGECIEKQLIQETFNEIRKTGTQQIQWMNIIHKWAHSAQQLDNS
jgi:hypothetical protein